jgi:hypothetical protein
MIKSNPIVLAAIVLGLIIGGTVSAVLAFSQSPIPQGIRKSATFDLYYPSANPDGWRLKKDSATYTAQSRNVIMTLENSDRSNSIVFSQQATPDTFTDVPDYYQKLLDNLHQYNEFDSGIGKVTLTRPDELKGGQSAVANTKSTLIFAHPTKDLTNAEWANLFNKLEIVR